MWPSRLSLLQQKKSKNGGPVVLLAPEHRNRKHQLTANAGRGVSRVSVSRSRPRIARVAGADLANKPGEGGATRQRNRRPPIEPEASRSVPGSAASEMTSERCASSACVHSPLSRSQSLTMPSLVKNKLAHLMSLWTIYKS